MSELSSALGGAAPKHTFTVGDKAYTMGLITQEAKVAFEKALFAKAREAARMMKEELGTEYMAALERLAEKYEEGEFALEGERGMKALGKTWGVVTMVSILMGISTHELTQLMNTNGEEIISLFRCVVKESFPGVKLDDEPTPEGGEKKVPSSASGS